jgi:hypothetical protein
MTRDHVTALDALAVLWCLSEGNPDGAEFLVDLYADDPWPLIRTLAFSTLWEVVNHHEQDLADVLTNTRQHMLALELHDDQADTDDT